ncbi:MAG: methyltransferase family protein [Minwuia sp.]|uniref:methyltransferase family protein n=1 Tax=Minwuia sp. TaxID=2493630 RepID=UPI003A88A995
MTATEHVIYALLWLSFGLGHSVLASACAKRITGSVFGTRERLAYNAIAVIHLAAIVFAGWFWLGGRTAEAFDLATPVRWAMTASMVLGAAVLLVAYRHYDGGRFTGWRPVAADAPPEPLHTAGLHRYVRHPLYSGALLMLAGIADDPFGLASSIWAAAYFIIGARYEERRLIDLYGDAYRDYRLAVPGFVPWKGRAI